MPLLDASSTSIGIEDEAVPRTIAISGMKITILANAGSNVPITGKPDDLGLWAMAPYGVIGDTDDQGERALYVFVGSDLGSKNVYLVPLYGPDEDARVFLHYKILVGFTDEKVAEAFVMDQFGRSYDLGSLVFMTLSDLEDWVEVAKLGPEPEEGEEGFLKDPDLTVNEDEKRPLFVKG